MNRRRLFSLFPLSLLGLAASAKAEPNEPSGYHSQMTPAWVQKLIEECAVFPNGMNDDQVDALSQALNWVRNNTRQMTVSMPSQRVPATGVLAGIDQW